MAPCQRAIAATKTRTAGASHRAVLTIRRRHASPERCSSSGRRCSPRCRSSSRTCVTSSKNRGSSRVSAVRGGRQVDVDDAGDAAGPGLITTTRVERKTASEIECVTKTTVDGELLPDREQLEVQALPGHLVERAERLVHQQQRRLEGKRACDRDALLHAARELPRMVIAEDVQLDEVEHLLHARLAPRAVPAEQLERQGDVLRDGAPFEQHRVLEDDPVVAVGARLAGGLAVDRDGAARRLDQVADHAQQRRLPAAGRADQRHELAGAERGRCPAARSRCLAGTSS